MSKLAALQPLEADAARGSWKGSEDRRPNDGETPHRLEKAVQRRLLSETKLRFSSLVIRRIPNGVCLEGVLETNANLDVCGLARSVAGVNEVLNHLVVRQSTNCC